MTRKYGRLLLALLSIAGAELEAQDGERAAAGPRSRRVPVTVALVERLPRPGEPFVIVRRADASPRDLVLLPADADAARFSDAVRAFLLARAHPAPEIGERTIRVRSRSDPGRRPPDLPWAGRVIEDLRRAPPRDIQGIGTVRAVEIWLPRNAARR